MKEEMNSQIDYKIFGGELVKENAENLFTDKSHRLYTLKTLIDKLILTQSLKEVKNILKLFTKDDIKYLNSPVLKEIIDVVLEVQ